MSFLNKNYRLSTDPRTGLAVIEVTGRCTEDEAEGIEANCTRRYDMILLPHAAGANLKSFDGTTPTIEEVAPPTFDGRTYNCVKVDGRVNPFAPEQTGGGYSGHFILHFYIKYQEVGGVV